MPARENWRFDFTMAVAADRSFFDPCPLLPAVAPAAVANAIVDALKEFGVKHIDLPATPERVWRAMRKQNS